MVCETGMKQRKVERSVSTAEAEREQDGARDSAEVV